MTIIAREPHGSATMPGGRRQRIVLWWPARKTNTKVEVTAPAMMPQAERV